MDALSTLPTVISAGALLVSLSASIFSRRSWLETNRPIVTAEITTHDAGSESILFNIVVHNVGNRPATEIRLAASSEIIQMLVEPTARDRYKDEVKRCFSEEGRIAVLHPGKSVKNGFGLTSTDKKKNVLIYGASAAIEIHYKDLNSRIYKSKLTLIVRDSAYFAGSGWADTD
jgi:hypothetical protein